MDVYGNFGSEYITVGDDVYVYQPYGREAGLFKASAAGELIEVVLPSGVEPFGISELVEFNGELVVFAYNQRSGSVRRIPRIGGWNQSRRSTYPVLCCPIPWSAMAPYGSAWETRWWKSRTIGASPLPRMSLPAFTSWRKRDADDGSTAAGSPIVAAMDCRRHGP